MMLKRVLPFAHSLLQAAVEEGDVTVDATVGNGHDTYVLANLVGPRGKVYGFDIQQDALKNAHIRLQESELYERVELFLKSHDQIESVIPPELHKKIKAAIFNLGYLPGGDKTIVTTPDSSISAVKQLLTMMPPGGIIVLVVYHGHPEGQIERDQLIQYVKTIDQKQAQVLQYQFLNQINHAPFVIAIEKIK
ncbi:class I SAM-dependent methyltransferase [Schinkia azotoformans]|nr:class I SAM-dependent methyltransferase [Schinkia azotoformans]MEC1695316.1 class I SAM-dependent methyltransferase [Schinkia azotoformans]MEC1717885.1 class I SAM-dependent methyltransferase [Schinkia azotoformans]MEC1724660.1 class I SAM-dependent methyltransferase [Schinkia azotoformans]MEC1741083.1 class I SAM-dependent methyltransferase [Schinkia azotoformans]MEC1744228.1 class I SAM-dependent methyltransferase [Schinkia azotoformans]